MLIKTEKGLEIQLSPEELRHFDITNSEKLVKFVSALEKDRHLGFNKEKEEKK